MKKELEYEVIDMDRNDNLLEEIAANGDQKTLRKHYTKTLKSLDKTYSKKMKSIFKYVTKLKKEQKKRKKVYLKTGNMDIFNEYKKESLDLLTDKITQDLPDKKTDIEIRVRKVTDINDINIHDIMSLYKEKHLENVVDDESEKKVYSKYFDNRLDHTKRYFETINIDNITDNPDCTKSLWRYAKIMGWGGFIAPIAASFFMGAGALLATIPLGIAGYFGGAVFGTYNYIRKTNKMFKKETEMVIEDYTKKLMKLR